MLEVRNVRKMFGQNHVLNGVDLRVQKQVLIGSSGSGKTTFLRCLNFLERADESELALGDVSVNLPSAHKDIRAE
ncbi:MAG: hypothetical protein LBG27_00360 [Spirochaetaceae bacterium]|nr:hypothetical protein [Spirochaetaceae bacterium]